MTGVFDGLQSLFFSHPDPTLATTIHGFQPQCSRGVVAWMRRFITCCFFALGFMSGFCATPEPDADRWFTEGGVRPEPFAGVTVRSNEFPSLRAEVVANVLQVKCDAAGVGDAPRLIVSADAPGHWPARDWRTLVMRRAGPGWLVDVPVDSPDVPLIYFVAARVEGSPMVSPCAWRDRGRWVWSVHRGCSGLSSKGLSKGWKAGARRKFP